MSRQDARPCESVVISNVALMPLNDYTDDEYQALEERAKSLTLLATALEESLARRHLGQRKYTDDVDQYGCYPYRLADFIKLLFQARRALESIHGTERASSAKFLDVGCGIGSKVYLAGLHFESHGIENDAEVAEIARKLVAGLPRCRIIEADALTFANYGDFDAIYFYRPLHSEPLEDQLEEKIYSDAREDCLLLPMFPTLEPPPESFTPIIDRQLYLKTRDNELSNRLVAEFALDDADERQ
jgi:SAM-dependent methyltransferase